MLDTSAVPKTLLPFSLSFTITELFLPILKKYHTGLKVCAWKLWFTVLPQLVTTAKDLYRETRAFLSSLKEQLELVQDHPEGALIIITALQKHAEIERYLGQGTFFEVVAMGNSFESWARKCLNKATLDTLKRAAAEQILRLEASIWVHLQWHPHPHVPTLRENHTNDVSPYIDYWPAGEADLEIFLKEHCHASSQGTLLKQRLMGWFGCVKNIILHLHEKARILHNDIKPSNFVLSGRHLYLIDYSTSRILTRESGYTFSGTIDFSPLYCAPECKCKYLEDSLPSADTFPGNVEEFIGFAADIFSLGILFLNMLTAMCGEHPNTLTNYRPSGLDDRCFSNPKKLDWIKEFHLPNLQHKKVASFCSLEDFEEIKKLIVKMISVEPTDRPRASEIRLPAAFETPCCSLSNQTSIREPMSVPPESSRSEGSESQAYGHANQNGQVFETMTIMEKLSQRSEKSKTAKFDLNPFHDRDHRPRAKTPDQGLQRPEIIAKKPSHMGEGIPTLIPSSSSMSSNPSSRFWPESAYLSVSSPVSSPFKDESQLYQHDETALFEESSSKAGQENVLKGLANAKTSGRLTLESIKNMGLITFDRLREDDTNHNDNDSIGEGISLSFIAGPTRTALELSKRKSLQNLPFGSLERAAPDPAESPPNRQLTWPPERPVRPDQEFQSPNRSNL